MALIDEVEALGGMTKAVEAGMPKLRIEESAARRQARDRPRRRDDRRRQQIPIGRGGRGRSARCRQREVRDAQIAQLGQVQRRRDRSAAGQALTALTEPARSGKGNLLALAIEASRARATVGEISDALEAVFTRHRAQIRAMSGRLWRPVPGR